MDTQVALASMSLADKKGFGLIDEKELIDKPASLGKIAGLANKHPQVFAQQVQRNPVANLPEKLHTELKASKQASVGQATLETWLSGTGPAAWTADHIRLILLLLEEVASEFHSKLSEAIRAPLKPLASPSATPPEPEPAGPETVADVPQPSLAEIADAKDNRRRFGVMLRLLLDNNGLQRKDLYEALHRQGFPVSTGEKAATLNNLLSGASNFSSARITAICAFFGLTEAALAEAFAHFQQYGTLPDTLQLGQPAPAALPSAPPPAPRAAAPPEPEQLPKPAPVAALASAPPPPAHPAAATPEPESEQLPEPAPVAAPTSAPSPPAPPAAAPTIDDVLLNEISGRLDQHSDAKRLYCLQVIADGIGALTWLTEEELMEIISRRLKSLPKNSPARLALLAQALQVVLQPPQAGT